MELDRTHVIAATAAEHLLSPNRRKTLTLARARVVERHLNRLIAAIDRECSDDLVLRDLVQKHAIELRAAVLALWPLPGSKRASDGA